MKFPLNLSIPSGLSELAINKLMETFLENNKLVVSPVNWYQCKIFSIIRLNLWFDRTFGVIDKIYLDSSQNNILFPVPKMISKSIKNDSKLWELNAGNSMNFFENFIDYFDDVLSISPETPTSITLIFRTNEIDLKTYHLVFKTSNKVFKYSLLNLLSEIPTTLEYASQRGIDINSLKEISDFLND